MPTLAHRTWVLSVARVAHYPSDTQIRPLRDQARRPQYDRRLPLDGGTDAGFQIWVDPKTHVPIKEVVDHLPLFETTQTWIEYKTLPITPVNERLVSLIARHPHARIDRNRNDYLRAANGDVPFPG